jgi:hypothetical protein
MRDRIKSKFHPFGGIPPAPWRGPWWEAWVVLSVWSLAASWALLRPRRPAGAAVRAPPKKRSRRSRLKRSRQRRVPHAALALERARNGLEEKNPAAPPERVRPPAGGQRGKVRLANQLPNRKAALRAKAQRNVGPERLEAAARVARHREAEGRKKARADSGLQNGRIGQEWIRTTEGVSQRIYSPPRLATSVPTRQCARSYRLAPSRSQVV